MKSWLLVSTLLIAGVASGGVRIETVTRDIKTQAADGAPNTTLIQGGAVRSNGGHDGSMILKGGKIVVLDDKRKTYTEMDKATLKSFAEKAKAAMAQMEERMKQMPPEQRAMMEKMMKGKMPGGSGKPAVFDAKDTGKTDTVEGRKCRIWNLTRDGELLSEMCVVPMSTLGGSDELMKTFKELQKAFEDLAEMAPDGAGEVKMRNSIDGYPVRTRSYLNGQLGAKEEVLKTWKEEAIPASAFEVPAGYTKKDLPKLGG